MPTESTRVREEIERQSLLQYPPFVEIRASRIPNAGQGAFAAVDIPVHTRLGQYSGVLRTPAQADAHPGTDAYFMESRIDLGRPLTADAAAAAVVRAAAAAGDRHVVIDAFDLDASSWTRYINNSRNRSSQNVAPRDLRNGIVVLSAAHRIRAGEELFFFYGRTQAQYDRAKAKTQQK